MARRHRPPAAPPAADARPRVTDLDVHLFREGSHLLLGEKLGSHPGVEGGVAGVRFAVWAPGAAQVSVVGSFNDWDPRRHPLTRRGEEGIWEGFIPRARRGDLYKYRIVPASAGGKRRAPGEGAGRGGEDAAGQRIEEGLDKADPFARFAECPPGTASRVWTLDFRWTDGRWMRRRRESRPRRGPFSIYEVHAGSWRRGPGGGFLNWRELARTLGPYAREMGFTHVELLPVMEHPFHGSWGYQVLGYFSPTARHGTPRDFMSFVNSMHRQGIGVILDWVPSHFPRDGHGLGWFDGTHLYEPADPRRGLHPDWDSFLFDHGRPEVRSFLLSSALFWLDRYHADGLRVDAVASMLHLDYSRKDGEWIPNEHGGRENLDAAAFLQRLNREVRDSHPGACVIAEDSSAWPGVTRDPGEGGLGFTFKWDMGWMNDTLRHVSRDPIDRRHHHREVTFRMMYAFAEHFLLPLSHDEVVHGKRSLLGRMPGGERERFAGLRLLLADLYGQPGKKLLFMGGEFGQIREWNHDAELDWDLCRQPGHRGAQNLVRRLNELYRSLPALHALDGDPEGFRWIACDDAAQGILAFERREGAAGGGVVVVVLSLTPVLREGYRIGMPRAGTWRVILSTDEPAFGGFGKGSNGFVEVEDEPMHGRSCSAVLAIPPLGALFLTPVDAVPGGPKPAGRGPGSHEPARAKPSGREPAGSEATLPPPPAGPP